MLRMLSHKEVIIAFMLVGIISAGLSQTTVEDALETITAEDLMRSVRHLASEELEGRLSGSEGYGKAAEWVADRFEEYGLKPMGEEGSFFQHFEVEYNRILSPAVLKLLVADSVRQTYTVGEDFVGRGFSGQGLMTAPVAFCGYGISSAENDYDDYVDADVVDRIVMVFKGSPPWEGDWEDARMPRIKAHTAHRQGAIGMMLVSEPNTSRSEALIGSVFHGPGEQLVNFPAVHISQETAADFLEKKGVKLTELLRSLEETHQPHSFPLGVEAHIEIHALYQKRQDTMNVLGFFEGSDTELMDEVVIIGAHLDHVGSQAGAIMFPGANDNASGVAALIEIAEALSLSETRPKRSILLIAFSAEEQGILGSRHYAANPSLPLDRTVAMINMDCIGAGTGMRVGGGKDYPDLFEIVRGIDEKYTHCDLPTSGPGGGADAAPFHELGVPNLYFATTSGYAHLHQISDTPETLNPPLFEKAARLAFLTVWAVTNEK